MRNQVWHPSSSKLDSLDLPELVLGFLRRDAVDSETAFDVIDEAEILACLLERDYIHETGWEGCVGSDLVVYFDETLHEDGIDFATIKGIF